MSDTKKERKTFFCGFGEGGRRFFEGKENVLRKEKVLLRWRVFFEKKGKCFGTNLKMCGCFRRGDNVIHHGENIQGKGFA